MIDSSSDSSEEVPEGDDVDTEAEEPLVRCKRPICAMYCENGFKTDHAGCPICACRDDPERPLIGRPDGHERPLIGRPDGHERPLIGRPDGREVLPGCRGHPLCRMYCPFGYKRDEDGCQICSCHSDPCQVMMLMVL